MSFRAESDDPTANIPLMTALGRLVVRASELDEDVGAVLARLRDPQTKQYMERKSLGCKLREVQSIAEQNHETHELFLELSLFCSHCLCKLNDRNSPVHSTYLLDEDVGIVKWDARCGPAVIRPADIEQTAAEIKKLSDRAVEYNLQLADLYESGALNALYAPTGRQDRGKRC